MTEVVREIYFVKNYGTMMYVFSVVTEKRGKDVFQTPTSFLLQHSRLPHQSQIESRSTCSLGGPLEIFNGLRGRGGSL